MASFYPISAVPVSSLAGGPTIISLTGTDILIFDEVWDDGLTYPLEDTLNLVQDLQEGILESITSNLTLTDQLDCFIDYAISIEHSILDDLLEVSGDWSELLEDTLTFFQSFEDILLLDELILSQQLNFNVIETQFIEDTLTITDQYDFEKAYPLSFSHNLTFVDFLTSVKVVNVSQTNNLIFFHELLGGLGIEIEICQSIDFKETLGTSHDLTLEDTLTFTEPEREIIVDELVIDQTLITNMDNEDCLSPGGKNEERELDNSLTLTTTIVVNIDYNLGLIDNPTFYNTTMWRT